jgi:hypothetical protein
VRLFVKTSVARVVSVVKAVSSGAREVRRARVYVARALGFAAHVSEGGRRGASRAGQTGEEGGGREVRRAGGGLGRRQGRRRQLERRHGDGDRFAVGVGHVGEGDDGRLGMNMKSGVMSFSYRGMSERLRSRGAEGIMHGLTFVGEYEGCMTVPE